MRKEGATFQRNHIADSPKRKSPYNSKIEMQITEKTCLMINIKALTDDTQGSVVGGCADGC